MKKSRFYGHQTDRWILRFEDGRVYYSKATERKFFFALTLIMLFLGAIFRLEGLL
jgi:hypothetical protein